MNERIMRDRRRNADELKYPSLPEVITCPKCGFDMLLWTADETKCVNCGHRFFRRESTVH